MAVDNLDNLPLEWVRVFEAAGRTGSFTAAAAEIGLTQAAVSQRIRNLEDRIGASLFSRQPRGVTLTIDGEAWLPYVSNALQSLNQSSEALFGKPLRKISILSGPSVAQLWIIPRLVGLANADTYQISLATMNVTSDFARENTTIDIRYGIGDWPDLQCAKLYVEALTPMVDPRLLQSGQDWRELPRIAVSGPRSGWQDWAIDQGEPAPPIPKYRFDNMVAAITAAKAGAGVLLASVPLCLDEAHSGALVPLVKRDFAQDGSYWMTASKRLPKKHWQDLCDCLCQR